MSIRFKLNASEDNINIKKQAEYCIGQTQRYMETQKKQKYRNKLSLQYILPKSNQEKVFAKLIPFTARIFPQTFNDGQRFTNTQYSSVRVRKHKKQFLSREKNIESPQKYQQLKKYAGMLSQRKKRQQGGGIQSFWMFKKKMEFQETKKTKGKLNNELNTETYQQPEVNRTQIAYKRILIWGKQSTDALIPKNLFKNYVASKLGDNFASWFLNFYQFRTYITLKQFQQVCERFKLMKTRQSHVVTFFLYDGNADSFICPKDIFGVFQKQFNSKIQKDVLKIAEFVRKNCNRKQGINEQFKIEHVVIRDDWLTVKDYEMYFKKVDEPYLKAAGKKDTVFSKTFAVLDHRQKVRSVRKQMNQKKTMYDQLYGEIAKERKNHAFIQTDDYRLSYTFLHEIFGDQKSQLFKYCCDFIFNL